MRKEGQRPVLRVVSAATVLGSTVLAGCNPGKSSEQASQNLPPSTDNTPPGDVSPGISQDDLDAAIAGVREEYEQEIAGLKAEMDAVNTPGTSGIGSGENQNSSEEVPAQDVLNVWSGQAELNRLRDGNKTGREIAETAFDYLAQEANDVQDNPNGLSRADGAITALLNIVRGPGYDDVPNPNDETGIQATADFINWAKETGNVNDILHGDKTIDDLKFNVTGTNLVLSAVWGDAHDWDATTAVLSAVLHNLWVEAGGSGPALFGETQVANAVASDNLAGSLRTWQDLIISRTFRNLLEISPEEWGRRNSSSDASIQVSGSLARTDQEVICEEMFDWPGTDGVRESQDQILRTVIHRAGADGDLTHADSEKESFLYFIVFNTETGAWDVMAMTTRAINNDPLNPEADTEVSMTLNELESCGFAQEVPEEQPVEDVVIVEETDTLPPEGGTNGGGGGNDKEKSGDPHSDGGRDDRGNDNIDDGDDGTYPDMP